jgi:cytochrome c oxidase subunit 3
MATAVENFTEQVHDNLGINRLGIWLFFGSEVFLFGAVISTRYYMLGSKTPDEVNQVLGLVLTALLLISSLTAYAAEAAAPAGRRSLMRWSIIATIVLGLGFLSGAGLEWYEAFEHFPHTTAYGTILFTTTGLHAFHLLTGLIMLNMSRNPNRFTTESHWGVEGVVKYWHFVDIAWVFIYPTLYLIQ